MEALLILCLGWMLTAAEPVGVPLATTTDISFSVAAPAAPNSQPIEGQLQTQQTGNPFFDDTANLIIFVLFAGSFIGLFLWLRSLPSEEMLKEQRKKKK